jgi:hypothetical protein
MSYNYSFNKSIIKLNSSFKRNRVSYNSISLNINWRKLPILLDKLYDKDFNISKAYINNNDTTLFIKNFLCFEQMEYIDEIVEDAKNDDTIYGKNNIILPSNTEILLYNSPKTLKNRTILEFSCDDRTGLLSDMIELLSCFPFEINEAYINTINDKYVNNIFLLQKNNNCLTSNEIEYISNIFEYEVKRKMEGNPLY